MTLFLEIGGVDLSDRVRLEDGLQSITSAADGSFGSSTIRLDDPSGNLTVTPWSYVTIRETACTPARAFTGYVYNQNVDRGPSRTAGGRVLVVDIVDLNELPRLRVLRASDAKRPAESGDARMAWLLASVGMAGLVYDRGQIGANVLQFGEADFRGQYAADVLASLCVSAGGPGVIFFVYWDHATSSPALFFRPPTAAFHDSTLRLSNVLADVDQTVTFPAYTSAELDRKGEDIYDGVYFDYVGGSVYRQRASTFATYGIHRDAVFSSSRIRSATLAADRAEVFLDNHAGTTDTVVCTARLPASKVNLLEAGQRVSVKFSHLPDFSGFTTTRVSRRTFALTPGTHEFYDVQLELTTKGITSMAGGGDPGGFPKPPTTDPSQVQSKTKANTTIDNGVTLDAAPTAGNLLVAVVGWRATTGAPSILTGFTQVGSTVAVAAADCVYLAYRIVQAGDTATFSHSVTSGKEHTIVLSEWSGTWTSPVDVSATATGGGVAPTVSITPTAERSSVLIGGAINVNTNTPADTDYVAGTGYTLIGQANVPSGHPVTGAVSKTVASTSGSYSPNMTATSGFPGDGSQSSWGIIAASFLQDANADPPSPGQEVPWAVVTMAGAVGTTLYPYADGSLLVKVDGILISVASYTETDPAAGTFTLDWVPDTDEVVTVQYLGR